ncbi:MAG: peptide chain release factor N(5)-glutamine methyltransferase [Candidatus Pseudothioglobus sp.]
MNPGRLIKNLLREDVEDASKLLGLAINKTQEHLFANLDIEITSSEFKKFKRLTEERKSGKPFAYIKGSQGFYENNFLVSPSTLIPRPETELLIDIALENLDTKKKIKVLDLGTGSGIIAITLSEKCPKWEISATDCSIEALDIAKHNAIRDIDFYCGSWFEPLPRKKFDLIVSNPPYISKNDPHLEDLRFEPLEALVSGNDGLEDIRLIISQSPQFLNKNGLLLLEHGYDQKDRIIKLLEGSFKNIKAFKDLNGIDRAIIAELR